MNGCDHLTRFTQTPDPLDLGAYRSLGGFSGLEAALGMEPDAVIRAVRESGLRGRGGAGFPTGVKWASLARTDDPPYVVCNADEGEPGTFKDRFLLEKAPYLMIEGLAIAAHAIGAQDAFVYIRGEYSVSAEIVTEAIRLAGEAGWFRRGAPGPAELSISVRKGGGSYVVGDETALLNSLMGNRGHPMIKPPYPTERGLWDRPTVINNVETLACVPLVLARGPEWFAAVGPADSPGPKLFCVSGHAADPGVYEFPMGVTVAQLLHRAGGVRGQLKAVQIGGTAGPFYDRRALDFALDYESMKRVGGTLGSGALVVMNSSVSMLEVLEVTARFFSEESCGQCFACRYGTRQLEYMADRISTGRGSLEYLDLIRETVRVMDAASLCPFGQAARFPFGTLFEHFGDELESAVKQQQYVTEVM